MVCRGCRKKVMAYEQGTNVVYLIAGRLRLKMVR
jgi:hypothetical protein